VLQRRVMVEQIVGPTSSSCQEVNRIELNVRLVSGEETNLLGVREALSPRRDVTEGIHCIIRCENVRKR
jgi:hypothetical protein